MIYHAYQTQERVLNPMREAAMLAAPGLHDLNTWGLNPLNPINPLRRFAAACEAMRLAERSGLDLQALGRVVRHTDALTTGPGAIMIRDNTHEIDPGHWLYDTFIHTRGLGEKDLNLALALGDSLDVDLPLARIALRNLAAGLGVPHREE
jgi:hypothetical protein